MSDTKIDKAFVDEEAPTPPPSSIGGKDWATDSTKGLTTTEVEKSLEEWGRNEIEVEVTPIYVLFLRQFTGFMPFLIELAAIISLAVQVSWLSSNLIAIPSECMLQHQQQFLAYYYNPSIFNLIVSPYLCRRSGLRRLCHCMWNAFGERMPRISRGIPCQEELG